MTSMGERLWLVISAVFDKSGPHPPALRWMDFRLQAMAEFNPARAIGTVTYFNPDKTKVMLEFALLGDMLIPTENEAECQEQ